jgi:hypothetical protein
MAKRAANVLSCPGGKGGASIPISIFLSSSEFQFTTLDGKFNSGYYIGKGDKIFQVIDLGRRDALSGRE